MTFMRRIPLMAAAVIAFAFSSLTAEAENRAMFPKDFSRYVLYATYDRGSSKEEAFATPETLALAKFSQPLPPGTQLVLSIWSNNKLTDYFVMEKGVDWGQEVAADKKTGDWHFQQFDPNGQMRRTAIAGRCESCHQGQASNDFMFTRDRMDAYLP